MGRAEESSAPQACGPLAFVHVPKCSGTSFEWYLSKAFAAFSLSARCFTGERPGGGLEAFDHYVQANRDSPFVYGHVPLCLYRKHFPAAVPVGFLRDPVARTVSNYRSWHDPRNFNGTDPHSRIAGDEQWEAMRFAQSASLEAFVNSEIAYVRKAALGDVQTQMLSTHEGSSMAAHLESAKRNLETMVFFGITERFAESIQLFRRVFRDAPGYALPTENENRSRVEIDPPSAAVIETIRAQVPCDIELYRFACGLFEERLRAHDLPRMSLAQIADSARRQTEAMPEASRVAALQHENADLRARLGALSASHAQLSAVYHEIAASRGWRLLAGVQRVIERLRGK